MNMKVIFAVMNTTYCSSEKKAWKIYDFHFTDIAEVMGSNPVQAWFFSSLHFTTA